MDEKCEIIKITGEEFLKRFHPRKDCKHCIGRGYNVFNFNGKRNKVPCKCVMKQYLKSGLKIKLVAPGGKKDEAN